MKKIITILVVIGMLSLQGCEGPEGIPGQDGLDALAPQAFEIKNKNLIRVTNNEYNFIGNFQSAVGGNLFDDETILVYRLVDVINSSTPVWELLPRTINFLNNDYIEYYFSFSKIDFKITAYGNYNLLNRPDFIDNQTFRVVILPSKFGATLDKNNFNAVILALNIKESQIQKINF
jgi:hypothetical protein